MTDGVAQSTIGPRRRLLVLASTYPRWPGDPEPGFVHELARRLTDRFDVTVLCPHAPGAATRVFTGEETGVMKAEEAARATIMAKG